ncbi:MAG: DNA-binding protein [Parcubacteria group bacterium GW2011_GWF2_50_9]|nr:MAG: DNA-binding protein [Parcubacteria group bacterium GW2011_GWF2_50_9]
MGMDAIKKLKIFRLENKLTQEMLAEQLGVAFSTVNRWLRGKCKPSQIQAYHVEKFMRGFKVKNNDK